MSQIAKKKFPCAMLLGGLSVNLNHLKTWTSLLLLWLDGRGGSKWPVAKLLFISEEKLKMVMKIADTFVQSHSSQRIHTE